MGSRVPDDVTAQLARGHDGLDRVSVAQLCVEVHELAVDDGRHYAIGRLLLLGCALTASDAVEPVRQLDPASAVHFDADGPGVLFAHHVIPAVRRPSAALLSGGLWPLCYLPRPLADVLLYESGTPRSSAEATSLARDRTASGCSAASSIAGDRRRCVEIVVEPVPHRVDQRPDLPNPSGLPAGLAAAARQDSRRSAATSISSSRHSQSSR